MKVEAYPKRRSNMTNIVIFLFVVGSVLTHNVQASTHYSARLQTSELKTYVIHTYGGASLLPAVRQALAGHDGSATVYQDKLIIHTTPNGYQAVSALLSQIDQVPQTFNITIRVGHHSKQADNIRQGRIIISNQNVLGTAQTANTQSYRHTNQSYNIQTLSGKPASIGTSTLLSLATPILTTQHNRYDQSATHITIFGTTLVNSQQGIAITPTLLPNTQVQLQIAQVQTLLNQALSSQNFATTVQVTRGQWVDIGQIFISTLHEQSDYKGHQNSNKSQIIPIQIRVD